MSLNRYKPHVFVLPEDDANRQIANGFLLHPNLNARVIQVLKAAGGWGDVVSKFAKDHVPEMRRYQEERLILLIDFDDQFEHRLPHVNSQIPDDLQERVFVLGVLSEPERLRSNMGKNFEEIGEALANNCADNTNELWEHELLKHNKIELERIISSVKPFLFT
ncbi:hypothetical protein IQ244_09890 [Nostoc sp. LEGE 06077]|uniref:hypothetical protein n=1 Tax=Nostoc sp. LEGE 06077 TaxID=915325 RepID=UPI00187FCBC4|nr:hypothetical protein [Nostoc sp. LEGE 06077]MBE9206821.1 hypothetical protein [Nostoc sp. LEGE 06077]